MLFVADFALAHLLQQTDDEQAGLVQTEAIIGNSHYLSPEQMRGHRDIDHRTDIYALGVMLFEMLTSQLPYQGETFLPLTTARTDTPVPEATALNPDLPKEIDVVIAKAMAKTQWNDIKV